MKLLLRKSWDVVWRGVAEYMNAVPSWLKPKTFHYMRKVKLSWKKSPYGNWKSLPRDTHLHFPALYRILIHSAEISSQKVKMPHTELLPVRALSSSFLCSGWGPCCAMRGTMLSSASHIKQMFPSVKMAVRWQLANIKILEESPFLSHKPWQGGPHTSRSWSHLSPLLFLPSLAKSSSGCDRSPWTVVTHGHLFLMAWGESPGSWADAWRIWLSLLLRWPSSCVSSQGEGFFTLPPSLRALISPWCPTHVPWSPADTPGYRDCSAGVFGKETDTLGPNFIPTVLSFFNHKTDFKRYYLVFVFIQKHFRISFHLTLLSGILSSSSATSGTAIHLWQQFGCSPVYFFTGWNYGKEVH